MGRAITAVTLIIRHQRIYGEDEADGGCGGGGGAPRDGQDGLRTQAQALAGRVYRKRHRSTKPPQPRASCGIVTRHPMPTDPFCDRLGKPVGVK